jgi:hypothetical protein
VQYSLHEMLEQHPKEWLEDTSLTGDFCDGFCFIMTNFIDHSIVNRGRRRYFELTRLLSVR